MKTNILKLALIPATLCSMVSCATTPLWETPSGQPEVTIKGNAQSKVTSRMVGKMWNIERQTPNMVTYERQQLTTGSRIAFGLVGDFQGIVDGWNVSFIPSKSGTRAILSSAYVKTKDYGKVANVPSKKAGDEFLSTMSGL